MDPIGEAYDDKAELYAELFLDELDKDTQSTTGLTAFADMARGRRGRIVDLGCGPGSAVRYLSELGLTVTGIDISPGQIAQARLAFPELEFQVGDLEALPFADESLGGIVSRYSLIHLHPSDLDEVLAG